MKLLFQFLVIVLFSFCGELLHQLIPLPVPASIYGIILLFLALEFKVVRLEHVEKASSFLIEVMPVLFLPPAVGLMESWGLIKGNLLQYITIIMVSTFAVMASAGWVTQLVTRYRRKP